MMMVDDDHCGDADDMMVIVMAMEVAMMIMRVV